MEKYSDVLIVGGGIAGLTFAIKLGKLKPEVRISVLTKDDIRQSNSKYAQGGIAAVTDLTVDSFENHYQDTMKSGNGLSDAAIVRKVVSSAPFRINDLIELGVKFTITSKNKLDMALEGGHSIARVVHSYDKTGETIMNTLISVAKNIPNISLFEYRFCSEIVKSNTGKASGVIALNLTNNQLETFYAKVVVLATGGSGQVYEHTTNPKLATGDGLAMGMKIGAEVSNLNYVQFHPTALFQENQDQLFLITEAVRGFGAHIINGEGKRFIYNYDSRGELATRDIVSSAIYKEIQKTNKCNVYLDCRHLDLAVFKSKFPTVFSKLTSLKIDVSTDLIPIVPAAHYQCGGLKVNDKGQTNITDLYAIGECAETGLHGANRLASNSLLEALVFAHEAAEFISRSIDTIQQKNESSCEPNKSELANDETCASTTKRIREIMSNFATIIADADDLSTAHDELVRCEEKLQVKLKDKGISEQRLVAQNVLANALAIVHSKMKHLKKSNQRKGTSSHLIF